MGINATVMCNCYREGRARPCPVPEHFYYDPSVTPSLDLDVAGHEEEHARFKSWLLEACPHPYMVYASEFISSWRGFRTFSDAVEELGVGQFPMLNAQLPGGDDGITIPRDSVLMLEEIALFEAKDSVMVQAVLVDTDRNVDISMGSHVLGGALTMDRVSGYDLGFDNQGFFVRDRWEGNRDLFRAMNVEQRLLHPEDLTVEYFDMDGGNSFRCKVPFGKPDVGEDGVPRMFLQHFHVALRPTSPDRFAYILAPLKRILEASIEMGNPIRWT